MKSKVYYSKEISPENVVEMYQKLGKELSGKVAVKLHSGEEGNQNLPLVDLFPRTDKCSKAGEICSHEARKR